MIKMSSNKSRSDVLPLPPIQSPYSSPLNHPPNQEADTHALVVPAARQQYSVSMDLETRVNMLEQAHKILLEEMAPGKSLSRHDIIDRVGGVTYRDMGGVNRNMCGVKLSGMDTDHILRRITTVEDQLHSLHARLDQLVHVDTFRSTRDAPGDLRRSVEDLEKRYVGLDRALSRYRDDVSARGGAEAIVDLQKGFREVEHVVRNLARDVTRAGNLASQLQTTQLDTQYRLQSRLEEVGGVSREVQARVSTLETQRLRDNTWLKESFHSLEDRLSGVATNTTSSVKTLTFDLQRIQDKLQSVERLRDRLEDFQAEWKKEKTTMEEERREKTSEMMEVIQSLKKKQNEEGVGHGEAMPSLKEVSEEVAIHKKKFEDHKRLAAKSMSSLTLSVSLIEDESQATKRELIQVLEAEIKTRREEGVGVKNQCASIDQRCDDINNLLQTMGRDVGQNHTQLTESIKATNDQWKQAHRTLLADMSTRLSTVHIKEQERDSTTLERVQNINTQVSQIGSRLDQLEQVRHSRPTTDIDIQRIEMKLSESSAHIHRLAQAMHEIQMKAQDESSKRFQEILELRNELWWLKSRVRGPNTSTAPSSFPTHPPADQVGVVNSPTPEPHSLQSSPSLANKSKKSRRGRGNRHVMYTLEPTETMGTFTSAAPTPLDLRRILGEESESDYLNTETSGREEEREREEREREEGEEREEEREEVERMVDHDVDGLDPPSVVVYGDIEEGEELVNEDGGMSLAEEVPVVQFEGDEEEVGHDGQRDVSISWTEEERGEEEREGDT